MALGIRPGSLLRLTPENIQRLRKRDIFQEIWFRGVKSVGDNKEVEMALNGKETLTYPTKFVLLLDIIERDVQIFFEPSITSNFAEKKVHGSLELKHNNLFGLNQQAGIETKWKRSIFSPEIIARWGNDRFGRAGGWKIQLYQGPYELSAGTYVLNK